MAHIPACVVERFPEHWPAVTVQYCANKAFRSLCTDYADVVRALRRWEGANDADAAKIASEFRQLAAELEDEILQYVQP